MEMRCCGGGWGWVLLLQLKLMPLKSHPSTATPVQRWDKDGDEDRDVWAQWHTASWASRSVPWPGAAPWHRCHHRGTSRGHQKAGAQGGHSWAQLRAAAPLREGLSTVMFYSPHTPLLKCKKRKKISTGCCSL